VFTDEKGHPIRMAAFYAEWRRACQAVGLPDTVKLHDLRHAAGTLAAHTGATTKELMSRMGHSSPAAALRYQHAAERRDVEIADGLDTAIRGAKARKTSVVRNLPRDGRAMEQGVESGSSG
jgi:integrase